MEGEKKNAESCLKKMSKAVDELQEGLRPMLAALDSMRSASTEEELDAMTRARIHISLCYASNSLFWMYLRTQGIDPMSHPVAEEIARVQDAFMRMRQVEAGISANHKRKADRDRRKHIINAKKSAEKLSALVFPEENDLQRALQGIKRKRSEVEERREELQRQFENNLDDGTEMSAGSKANSNAEDKDSKTVGAVVIDDGSAENGKNADEHEEESPKHEKKKRRKTKKTADADDEAGGSSRKSSSKKKSKRREDSSSLSEGKSERKRKKREAREARKKHSK